MSGNKFSKDQKNQIKNDLEQFLHSYSGTNEEDSVIDGQLQIINQAPPIDFEAMHNNFKKQANNLTNSLLKFYVDLGVIDRIEYFKHKKDLDNSNLENIFFQIKSVRMMIEKIMEEINQGNAHPRLFEVFGQLQDKLGTAVKTQANYMLFLEDTYRRVKSESEQIASESGDGTEKTINPHMKGDYYVTAGTKNIMKEIGNETDVEFINDERHLTNPQQKDNVLRSKGLEHLIEKNEESEDISKNDLDDLLA